MLLLSLLLIMLSGGLSLLWSLVWTLRQAARQPLAPVHPVVYIVPGKRLSNGAVDRDFMARLQRAAALWHKQRAAVYLLGGQTAANTISEAQAGAAVLLQQGVDQQQVLLELHSRHTLENLQRVRAMIDRRQPLALISNRYHLPRLGLMAAGLGLNAQLVAAETSLAVNPASWPRWLLEAFYIHWYCVGRWWAKRLGRTAPESEY